MKYIIVQAGGYGKRMKSYTRNKPKALVPVDNLPILFHLFKKYPESKYLIIGDYKYDVLSKYLETFADVKNIVVGTDGEKGTCSGIANALKYIPINEPFLLIWSDLILPKDFEIPEGSENYIGISKDFTCRWSYESRKFAEEPSDQHGVAGMFVFKNKGQIQDVPKSGEFVAWLKRKNLVFEELALYKTKEYGLYETIETPESGRCRPFNQIEIQGDKIIKKAITAQGEELSKKESRWYEKARQYGIENIPEIYGTDPLVMDKVDGANIYMCNVSQEEKKKILENIVVSLKSIHKNGICEPDYFSMYEAYYKKTIARLEKVRNLIPGADQKTIIINNRICRNVFFNLDELREMILKLECDHFCFIHGDCTFSNMLADKGLNPYYIDPRGYFGHTLLYGDPRYDWAKVYYSLVGNYDQFNLKRFSLEINQQTDTRIILQIDSNGWENLENYFWTLTDQTVSEREIKLLHAIIWLSLTTYAWEDYDSVCAAFYNGLFYLKELWSV